MFKVSFAAATLLALATISPAPAKTLCTIVADVADGRILLERGDCRTRVTPASTFKIALALIGFDADFLKGAHDPEFPFKEGYVDWGGSNWKQPTDPSRWLRYSVVWYSQIISHALGAQRLREDAKKFGYGNADFSGDPGRDNGLDRAWIGSSLRISPLEQVTFLRKLLTGQLLVSNQAAEQTKAIIEVSRANDGWELHGKTGTAFPRLPDGSSDEDHGYGWYVGWAIKDKNTLVFARLNQDEVKRTTSSGLRARDQVIAEWPAIAAPLPH